MQITFLGTSAGIPTHARNVSAIALRFSRTGETWLFDCGEATQHQLMKSDLRRGSIRRIFITHLHGDHLFGLPGLLASSALSGSSGALDIYGPAGLAHYLEVSLGTSQSYPDAPFTVHEIEGGTILDDGYLTVTAAPLEHRISTFGYRVAEAMQPGAFDAARATASGVPSGPLFGALKRGETIMLPNGRTLDGTEFTGPPERGRVMAYCADTIYTPSAVELARNATLLIHEATFSEEDEELAVLSAHSTSAMAARVALESGAERLLLTHISSRYSAVRVPPTRETLLQEARRIFPSTDLADDFMKIDIPRYR